MKIKTLSFIFILKIVELVTLLGNGLKIWSFKIFHKKILILNTIE